MFGCRLALSVHAGAPLRGGATLRVCLCLCVYLYVEVSGQSRTSITKQKSRKEKKVSGIRDTFFDRRSQSEGPVQKRHWASVSLRMRHWSYLPRVNSSPYYSAVSGFWDVANHNLRTWAWRHTVHWKPRWDFMLVQVSLSHEGCEGKAWAQVPLPDFTVLNQPQNYLTNGFPKLSGSPRWFLRNFKGMCMAEGERWGVRKSWWGPEPPSLISITSLQCNLYSTLWLGFLWKTGLCSFEKHQKTVLTFSNYFLHRGHGIRLGSTSREIFIIW